MEFAIKNKFRNKLLNNVRDRVVSVIIPVYNGENYIERCLNSILNQTYTDLEILIINDGSTDRTEDIINRYIEDGKNVRCIYQKNQGVSIARNLGLKHAKGEYVSFVDSDDFVESTFIEKMYKSAKNNNSDMVVCGHVRYYADNLKKNEVLNYKNENKSIYTQYESINLLLNLSVKGYLWDKLFKREKLIENNFFLEPNRYIEDWFPTFKYVCEINNITFVNEALYYYVQRDSSALHTINSKLLEDYVYSVKKIKKYLKENKIKYSKKSMQVFECETFYSIIRYFYIIENNKYEHKFEIYKKLREYINLHDIYLERDFYFNRELKTKTKFKIFLWDFKIFHLIYKT